MSTIGDISYRTKWVLSKRYIQAGIVVLLITLMIAIPFVKTAIALTDVGCDSTAGGNCVFELDGNIVKNSPSSQTLPTDWGALFTATGATVSTLPSGSLDAHWVNDGPHSVPENTTFTTGSKDILNISNGGWQCASSNNLTPKDDILHAYSYAIISPPGTARAGDILLYAGFERFANNGAGDLGLWLLQDPKVNCSTPKSAQSFNGTHVNRDLLFVGEFSTGGSVTTLTAFEWTSSGLLACGTTGTDCVAGGATDCTTAPPMANFCARSNTGLITTPWNTQDKTSLPNKLATAEFFEVGIDLTRVYGTGGGNTPCINRFLFDTRTSPSTTATLMDYAIGALTSCPGSQIETTVSPTPIGLGQSTTDTATVTLSPSTFTVSGTVTFNAYASLSDCNAATNSKFSDTKTIGPASSPASVTSAAFTPTAPGTYYWTALYGPAAQQNGDAAFSGCAAANETLVVIGSSITTNVSPTPITLGGSATDTATVTLNPSTATVSGTVTFNVYGPFSSAPTLTSCTSGSLQTPFSPNTKSIGPATGSASVTSDPFTPSAPGFYAWIATYNPASPANGPSNSTRCGDSGEILVVFGIPKITGFDFTNTPNNNDPTLGSGTVTYMFKIHNYGASDVTLSGSLTVSGTASVSCTGGNTLTLSGLLASGADATFGPLTCTYNGTSGQTVSATINAMFAVGGNPSHPVSGSPTTYTFTIQQT